ncbi:MAG: 4-hydroxy-tetrahydrodipicolinate reductase [Prevotellaceae bacterium]|jgi:4-hydroxy-tetrahydrodipicolinate reductase|nr:4-hydroxy-tetrahydrodipicolinate reductase [Prevotellaceae bacterium]
MNIALIGYGKMGKEVEAIALERGHAIALTIDVNNQADLNAANLAKADVAIEFTTPGAAVQNMMTCFEAQMPIVCGTTGWLAHMEQVKQSCAKNNGGLFYASNYSVGVNVFFKVSQYLAKLMSVVEGYSTSIEEIHHTAKKDAPSGTAITIAEGIMKEISSFKKWINQASGSQEELPIVSVRQDPMPGTHAVTYSSDVDIITIAHEAKSRKGFALGAVLAAEFMCGKTGCYGMDDLLKL